MKKTKAKINDQIEFVREGYLLIGLVESVRDNSVIVEISYDDASKLNYVNNKTVVSHSNYIVIE
ncbi:MULTISPECIES: DUF2187 family protein [Robertmurraya]|uniref:DUF2187 family protein n=1 Tax=Robertmurraya beringensis TaxID=641660 RepID=A0ABV6KVQ6_9BACI